MKSIFAAIGVIAIVLFVLGNAPLRAQLGQWFEGQSFGYNPDCEQPATYAPTGIQGGAGEFGTMGRQALPVPYGHGHQREVSSSFEYDHSSGPVYQRVWVQPQYRTIYRYGRRETVVVAPGYWRQIAQPGRQKHVAFDFGGMLNSFR